jgi:uncharacterized membrane protein (UPF0182 family)
VNRRRVVFGVLAAVAAFLLVGRWVCALYVDYLWYASLGAVDVWRMRVGASFVVGAATFAAASLFAFVNLYAVRHSVVSLVLPRRIANIEIGEEVPSRYLLLATAALAVVVGSALTLPADNWTDALLARIGQPFGETDPYFGADLGFFVYWLPFETTLHYWAILVISVVAVLVVVLYALTPSLRWDRGHLYVSTYVRRHFIMLGGVVLGIVAWSFRLRMYHLLAAGGDNGPVFSAIDHRVLVPAMLLLAVVTLCAAVVVVWAGWSGQMRLAFLAVSTVIVLSIVARSVAPLLARRAVDPSAAAIQERPYIATRLGYTRRAYGVDRIRPESLGAGFATALDAAPRVAAWDGATLAQAAQRLRRVRISGDGAGWQETARGMTAALVEHNSDSSGSARDVWGVTRYDPASADDRGLPVRASDSRGPDELLLDEPAVYASAPSYSLLSDSLHRLVGVEMASTSSRIAHAWALQNYRLLFGDLPADRPVIVRRRDVRDRVAALVPFLEQGSEVVPVVDEDSLYWAIELYSTSETYPLSQRFTLLGAERGYLQHAATALVHATSGGVRIVLAPSPDPVAASWAAVFPRLFVRLSTLPPRLQAALPSATDGAHAQALAFASAGFRGDSLEVRHLATLDGADSATAREPGRIALRGAGMAALWPLLDEQERVRGVVAAQSGPQRATVWIPLLAGDQRWGTVLDRLRAGDSASHENGLARGAVRVVPVASRPLYVQSVFQWRPASGPRLLRVVALDGDSVRVGPTLEAAIGNTAPTHVTARLPRDLRQHADSLYQVMRAALQQGDWVAFGRAFDALGAALRGATP